MKLQPLYDKIVVEQCDAREITKGGVHLPETSKEKPREGIVKAAGEGRMLEDGRVIPLKIVLGDRVMFSPYGGTEVEVDGDKYLIMSENDVLAVVAD